MTASNIDAVSYLKGYVAGYWEGWDFAVDEEKVVVATGSALAPTPGSASEEGHASRAPGPLTLPVSPPSSPAPPDSSLAAIRRLATGGEVDDLVFHQGTVHALRVAVELLRHHRNLDGADIVEGMIRGYEGADEL